MTCYTSNTPSAPRSRLLAAGLFGSLDDALVCRLIQDLPVAVDVGLELGTNSALDLRALVELLFVEIFIVNKSLKRNVFLLELIRFTILPRLRQIYFNVQQI